MNLIKLALRVMVGAFFIVSAVGKLMSIDAFEVFIYRTTFLNYDMATVAARLLIGAEFLIAIFLLIKLRFKFTWWVTLLFLLVFSGFLLVQIMSGSDDNCFCLGELVDFSPTESLIKNLVLIVFLLIIRQSKDVRFKYENWAFGLLLLAGLSVPLLISPPDVFIAGKFNPAQHDQQALQEALEEGSIPYDFVENRKLLAFYSTGCKFCKMSSTRIGTIIKKAEIDTSKLNIIFWGDSTVQAQQFFDDTHAPVLNYVPLETKAYLDITKGRMPLILLINDGIVEHKMNYRTIDEELIVEFLEGN